VAQSLIDKWLERVNRIRLLQVKIRLCTLRELRLAIFERRAEQEAKGEEGKERRAKGEE